MPLRPTVLYSLYIQEAWVSLCSLQSWDPYMFRKPGSAPYIFRKLGYPCAPYSSVILICLGSLGIHKLSAVLYSLYIQEAWVSLCSLQSCIPNIFRKPAYPCAPYSPALPIYLGSLGLPLLPTVLYSLYIQEVWVSLCSLQFCTPYMFRKHGSPCAPYSSVLLIYLGSLGLPVLPTVLYSLYVQETWVSLCSLQFGTPYKFRKPGSPSAPYSPVLLIYLGSLGIPVLPSVLYYSHIQEAWVSLCSLQSCDPSSMDDELVDRAKKVKKYVFNSFNHIK